jgi:hypothetical protein
MPKYDNGERWDLKAKYTDEGYEDADADVMGACDAPPQPCCCCL